MIPLTLKSLTDSRAIRIAELALSSKIEHPFVLREKDMGVDVIYIFVDTQKNKALRLDDEYVKTYGSAHMKDRYEWIEIDNSFNITLKDNYTCNMALIYRLIFEWGYFPNMEGTGLFPRSGFVPQSLTELELAVSENLKE